MSTIKLTYFDIDGGRGEPTRIAMHIGGIEFEDHRISFQEFGKMRSTFPGYAVPLLEIDGKVYTQSNAMNRYFGKQAGLYPDDPWQAYLCDEAMGVAEDFMHNLVATFGLEGDELQKARQELVDGKLTSYLTTMNSRLEDAGGEYFADGRLTVADLKIFVWVRSLKSGILDHIPTDLVDNVAPLLLDHMNRVAADPGVASYYKNRGA